MARAPRVLCRARGFPAVAGRRPKVLILGSLPGAASIRLGQYYGHPQNKFWELLGAALGEDLRSLSYARRLARLKKRGVALWDVIAEADRPGSLDSAIRDEAHNGILGLVRRTGVRAVFVNGAKAQSALRRCAPEVRAVRLPSSSPANASVPWAAKVRAWRRIRRYL
ncbi:MAG: DNA-deoxyinosine glycosylase [Elusimicrobiota bacterium]|nr:MAG: DNA-deoxyinosine glycosylase [Elusimicrobiota bacterium]